MVEYPRTRFRDESTDRHGEYEVPEGVRSLRRYKKTPAYRVQLRRAVLEADAAEMRATSATEKAKVRLRKWEAEAELDHLESGGAPLVTSGLIALKPELSARLRQKF